MGESRPKRIELKVKDMPQVLCIENGSFEFPWAPEDFKWFALQRRTHQEVFTQRERIVGYMCYEKLREETHLRNFAVHEDYRERGIGSHMLGTLKSNPRKGRPIRLEVRETNVPAQMFFRSNGFVWTKTLKDFYDETPEDAYQMEYCKGHVR